MWPSEQIVPKYPDPQEVLDTLNQIIENGPSSSFTDVRDFGADVSSQDNTDAINAAISASERPVLIPGMFNVSGPIYLKRGVDLVGLSRVYCGINQTGPHPVLVKQEPNHNQQNRLESSISNLKLSGGTVGIDLSMLDMVRVDNCWLTGMSEGVRLTNVYHYAIRDSVIEDCSIACINLQSSNGVGCNRGEISGNELIGNNQSSCIGININGGQEIVINNNDLEGSGNGSKAIDMNGTEGVLVQGNYIELWVNGAIVANSGGGNKRLRVVHNVINALSTNICNLNDTVTPNDNIIFAHNRFADSSSSQTCILVGNTTNFKQYDNDSDQASIV